jgi:hypothetical protein
MRNVNEMWKRQGTGTMINCPFTVILEIDVYYTSIIVFGESIETLQIDIWIMDYNK